MPYRMIATVIYADNSEDTRECVRQTRYELHKRLYQLLDEQPEPTSFVLVIHKENN